MLNWLKSGSPAATAAGTKAIRDYVSNNPSQTRNTYDYSSRRLGDALRSDYMEQRGSGLPFVNKGMKLSEYLKSPQAMEISQDYGGYFSPRQGYEQWVRGETAPQTVDTRNDYQLGMNQLRNQYPGAYAQEFPWSNLMMEGLPKLAMGLVGSQLGIPLGLSTLPAAKDVSETIYEQMPEINFNSDDDEEDTPWWQLFKKANGGMTNYSNGGPHQDDGVPWTYTPPADSTYSAPPNPVNTYFGGSHDSNYDWNPPKHVGEDNLEAALSLAVAGVKNIGGDPMPEGDYTLTDTLNVSGQGPGTVFHFDETGQINPPSQNAPPVVGGDADGDNYYAQPQTGGTNYTGNPLFDDTDSVGSIGSDQLKEQGQKQFDTQFMAAQLLHDKSRGKFDDGGLADMSQNALGDLMQIPRQRSELEQYQAYKNAPMHVDPPYINFMGQSVRADDFDDAMKELEDKNPTEQMLMMEQLMQELNPEPYGDYEKMQDFETDNMEVKIQLEDLLKRFPGMNLYKLIKQLEARGIEYASAGGIMGVV
tara:strand:+ start:2086 stop:3678 length:1593 start_codon:yes stop_codon:yes gene_type:complete